MQVCNLKEESISEFNKTVQDHERKLTRIEIAMESINQTLLRLEKRADSIDGKLDNAAKAFDRKIDVYFKSFNDRLWNNFYWILAGFTSILGVLGRILHWI